MISTHFNCTVDSILDVLFSPHSVVMRANTSEGPFFLKANHPSSAETAVVSITSSKMTDFCDTFVHLDVSENVIISRDHGLSVYPFESLELKKESSACLGRAQVASIPFFDNLLSCGFLDARSSNFNGLVQTITNHRVLMWIENQRNTSFADVNAMRGLQPSLRTELYKSVEFAGNLRPVSLHNDMCSGNLFRAHGNKLKLFDFKLAIISHTFMEYSFRVIARKSRDSFCQSWVEECYNCSNVREIIKEFALVASVARLVLFLDTIEGARISEKLVLVPLISESCGMIAMHLPGCTDRYGSLSSYRRGTILQYTCRNRGEKFEESTDRSTGTELQSHMRYHLLKHFGKVCSDADLYLTRTITRV